MIDLFDITISINHRPFGKKRISEPEYSDQSFIDYYGKNVYLHEYGYPISVVSLNDGTAIGIRCSPLKALQGHNVFGTNNVCGLVQSLIRAALDRLNIHYTPKQLESWCAGNFEINELDITHRFRITPGVSVKGICTHMLRSSSTDLSPQWIKPGIGVRLYPPQSSTHWLFYDKKQELQDKRRKAERHLKAVIGDQFENVWSELIDTAGRSVRAELKLSKAYLKRHHLDRGSAWTVEKALALYFSELDQLRLGALDELPLPENSVRHIRTRTLKQTFALWAYGADLRDLLARSTLNSHRSQILRLVDIDIFRDDPRRASLRLSEIFSRENALCGFPKWTRTYPLAAYRPA